MPAALRIRLFGTLAIERTRSSAQAQSSRTQPIKLPTRKAEALLAYLLLHPDSNPREKLAALFWGDSSDREARDSLRNALALLRKHLGEQLLLTTQDQARLNPDFSVWVDVFQFRKGLGISPAAAADLYRGPLLADFYDDWIMVERQEYHELYVDALLRVSQGLRVQGEYESAGEYARRVLKVEPTNETAHQHLMFCRVASGHRSAALRQYEECTRILDSQLGVPPSAETTALYQWIKQTPLDHKAAEARPTNLPVPLTSFIGRQADIKLIKESLSTSRLLTITGAGGSGKTRLAIQAASELVDAFRDGVWWVDLAPLRDQTLVAQTVAKVLGVPEAVGHPIHETIARHLRSRQTLIVLDNCEHLIHACAELVAALLSRCPTLTVLATSREGLRIPGERIWQAPAMPLPTAERLTLSNLLMNFESIQLFVERAGAVQSSFTLDEQNASAVIEICRRVDGLPLAIEMAAARVQAFSPQEIAARLDKRFDLLTTGSRTALPRQQTLRALIDWSYDLLSAAEQNLLQRLSVFAGNFKLASAQQVCSDEALPEGLIPDLLSNLIAKSLLHAEIAAGEARYRMLETVREYAAEKLREAGEYDALNIRHRDFFLSLAELAGSHLEAGRAVLLWFHQLDAELENLRAALDWSRQMDQIEMQARIACALYVFWWRRGYFIEGRKWIEAPLARRDSLPRHLAGKMLWMASRFALRQGEFAKAKADADEAVVLCRELGDKRLLAMALRTLAMAFSELGDEKRDRLLMEEAMALYRELGDKHAIGAQLGNEAIAAVDSGDYTRAVALQSEGLAIAREFGDDLEVAVGLLGLAEARFGQGDHDRAGLEFREALRALYALGEKWEVFSCLEGLAAVANSRGQYRRAARLLGATEQQTALIGAFRKGYAARYITLPAIDTAQANLPQSEFEAAWAEGQAMSLDQAVAYALRTTPD